MTTKEALERLKQPFNATPDTDSYFDAKEVAIKSLEKDLSIVKELERIKEIIKSNRDEWIKGQDAEWHTYDRCLYIIDNHISKLKGEENDDN